MTSLKLPQDFSFKISRLDQDLLDQMIEILDMFVIATPDSRHRDTTDVLINALLDEDLLRMRESAESYEAENDFRRDNYFPVERTAWC